MRRLKKIVFGLSLLGTSVVPACSTLTLTNVRDAAIDGAANFVETTVFDVLTTLVGGFLGTT